PAATLSATDAEEIIKQAVGFKTDRDSIKVSDVRLATAQLATAAETEYEKLQYWQNIINIVRNASLGVAAVVALLLAWMTTRRLRPVVPPPAPPPEAPPEAPPTLPVSPERARVVERLSAAAQRDPRTIARLLARLLEQG